jgi:rubrerythrin
MQSTRFGANRTGARMSPLNTSSMAALADEASPETHIGTPVMDAAKVAFATEAEAIGSVPPPLSLKGVAKAGMAALKGGAPSVFVDKLGERLAFERSGTRLYEALIIKHQAAQQSGSEALPPAAEALEALPGVRVLLEMLAEDPLATLMRIRNEELAHFQMLGDCLQRMGGDPTAMTPSADVAGVATGGILQVVTDPRTTLAQALTAMLSAEVTDQAGWELLEILARDVGQPDLATLFHGALEQEQEHVAIIRSWLAYLLSREAGTAAV